MVHFPAFCSNCGLVFEASGIRVENSRNITLSNVQQNCPRCGAMAELPDGTFNVIGNTIEVLSASGLSRARLLRLAAVLREAHEGHMPPEAAAEQVVAEAPSLRPLVEHLAPRMRKAFVWFLLLVIELLLQQGVSELRDDSATREDVRVAVEEAMRHVQQQAPPSRPAPSASRPAPTRSARRRNDSERRATETKQKRPAKTYGVRKRRKRR
jgi:hypothetical protein